MKKILLGIFFLLGLILPSLGGVSIFLAQDATEAEKTAALELKKGLNKIFGIKAGILRKNPKKCTFWVGQSKEAGEALEIKDFSVLKPDEILLKTVNGKTILLGERPRGTIYAVYEFLERGYGVRFWSAKVEHWPRHKKFFVPEIDHRFAPQFQFRSVYYDLIRGQNQKPVPFSVKIRSNRSNVSPKWGGKEEIIGFVHTMGKFVPASKYFKDHPEWFALRDGKRSPYLQPCMTNKEFRKTLIAAALEELRKHPNPRIISITQNDGRNTFCQCENCRKFIRKHGNKSDLLMDVVNEAADAIAAEFPNVKVLTLAYSITLPPPKSIVPRKNVIIEVATDPVDPSQPMASSANAERNQYFKAWHKIGNPLSTWTYETDFKRFYLPFPNWKGLLNNLRFYADSGIIGIFQQGSYAGSIADLADLRVWVLGKLQWNPYLDPMSLVREFAEGYYGKAAPQIVAYIEHMSAAARKGRYEQDGISVDGKDLVKARKILLAGEKAVASDPVLLRRMQIAAVPVNLALLQLHPELWENPPPELQGVNWRKLLDEQMALIESEKITRLAEPRHITPEVLKRDIIMRNSWEKGNPPVPGYPENTKWKQIGAADSLKFTPSRWVDDPAALNGKAVEADCDRGTWFSQVWWPPKGNWDIYVELQCTGKTPSGEAASFGCYDRVRKELILSKSIDAKAIAAPGYHIVKFGHVNLDGDQFIFCAVTNNASVDRVRVSRYIFIQSGK